MTSEIDALHGLAAAADLEATPTAPEVGADGRPLPAAPDYANEAAAAVDTFAALVVGYCPATEETWGTETKARIAGALAPVMEKYSMTFGNLPPELMLLIVAGPPLYQSSKLLAAQIQAEQRKEITEKAAQSGIPARAPDEIHTAPAQAVHAQMGLYPVM